MSKSDSKNPPQVPEDLQRWTSKRRVALMVSILKGETSAAEAARKHGLTVGEVEDWKDRFLLGAENALRSRPKDEEVLKDEQIKKLKQRSVTSCSIWMWPRRRSSYALSIRRRPSDRESTLGCLHAPNLSNSHFASLVADTPIR